MNYELVRRYKYLIRLASLDTFSFREGKNANPLLFKEKGVGG
jgi:hypothetical protein